MQRNAIYFLACDLGDRLARGTRVRVLGAVPAVVAGDALGSPVACAEAVLCILPDAPVFGQFVIDPTFLSAERPADDAIDEAAAHAALVDALSGDAGGSNAHIFDPLALGHTFYHDLARGRVVVLEDDGGDVPAHLRPLAAQLDAHRGAFGEPETCIGGDQDAGPGAEPPPGPWWRLNPIHDLNLGPRLSSTLARAGLGNLGRLADRVATGSPLHLLAGIDRDDAGAVCHALVGYLADLGPEDDPADLAGKASGASRGPDPHPAA